MKDIRWNQSKSEQLKKERGLSFEDIIKCNCITILQHPVKTSQKLMLFEHNQYIWVVPCVEEKEYIFLKTLFPSRKYTKIILGEKQ